MNKLKPNKNVYEGNVVQIRGKKIFNATSRSKRIDGVFVKGKPEVFERKGIDLDGKSFHIRFDYFQPEGIIQYGHAKVFCRPDGKIIK